MKPKPLTLALIGAGGIGQFWSDAIAQGSNVSLRAVVDTNVASARSLAKKHGCRAESDSANVFADAAVDAVIIATPHSFLAPLTRKALFAGKHVLCEKPAGISAREVETNSKLARKKKRIYMIGFNHRYHPAYQRAKELCHKGILGKLLNIRARYGFRGRPGYDKEWRFNKKISGGGQLMDQGMHLIDLVRHFLGEVSGVQGYAQNAYWGAVDDNAFLVLKTKRGQVAQLHASWTEMDWTHCFEIFGEKGMLRIDGLDSRYGGPERLTISLGNRKTGVFKTPTTTTFSKERKEDSFGRELAVFRDVIRKKTKEYPSGSDAVAALRIVEAVYRII